MTDTRAEHGVIAFFVCRDTVTVGCVGCYVIFLDNASRANYCENWTTMLALRDDVDGHVILRGRTSGPQIERHCAIDCGSLSREHCRAVCVSIYLGHLVRCHLSSPPSSSSSSSSRSFCSCSS